MSKPNLFISGGSRGIGASLATLAAARGYRVILSYNKEEQLANNLIQEIKNSGGDANAVQLCINDPVAVGQFFNNFESKFGPLSALVNNAGIVDLASRVEEISAERLQHMFSVNFFGSFYCCQAAVKLMSHRYNKSGGVIVNVSSAASRLGSPNEYVDYAASKAAVDTMTLGLAKEVANEGIRVISIRPGLIDTDLHKDSGDRERPHKLAHLVPMQRPGTADEIAETILFCLSDKASYITGTCIDVSGGR